MAKKKKATRKAADKDYEVIGFRLTAKEKSQIKKNATASGMSISDYLRAVGTGQL